jgi:hypothetical protein
VTISIAASTQALERAQQELDRAAQYNERVPSQGKKVLVGANATAQLNASQRAHVHNYVGKPDYGTRVLERHGIDLAAARKEPQLASMVAAVDASLERYGASVLAAHAAIDAL